MQHSVALVSILSIVTTVASAQRNGTAYQSWSRCQQLRLGRRAPTGHNWREVYLQRGSGVRIGWTKHFGGLRMHTSCTHKRCIYFIPRLRAIQAMSAPNDPYSKHPKRRNLVKKKGGTAGES